MSVAPQPGRRPAAPIVASIIIPSLNSPLIAQVLAAVASQAAEAGGPVEIIVVGRDDAGRLQDAPWPVAVVDPSGSPLPGRSSALAAGEPAASPSVLFVETPQPRWPGAARNLGLKLARGEQVVLLDADCLPRPGWLATLLAHQAAHGCMVGGSVVLEPGDYWLLCANIAGSRENLSSRPPAARSYLPSFNLCASRTDLLAAGGFDEGLRTAEDLDFSARLFERGQRLCFEPGAQVAHRSGRCSLRGLAAYGYLCGGNSLRVRQRHPGALPTPRWMFSPLPLLALAPVVAAATAARTFVEDASVRRYWTTAPVVFLVKLAWCLGASRTARGRSDG